MRAIWVDEGNDAQYAKLASLGITDVYFSVRDPRVNLAYLTKVQGHGFKPGLYACSQGEGWPSPTTMSGPAFADWVYQKVQLEIAPGTMGAFPKVMLNMETHDTQWVVGALKRWRKRSPRRETYFSPEGRQAGRFSSQDVTDINAMNIGVVPQAYAGNLNEQNLYEPHLPGVIDELIKIGLDASRLWLFWDAAWTLPYNWQGFAFTQGRLP